MERKVRVTLTGIGSAEFIEQFFGRKLRRFEVMKISNEHWVIEFPEGAVPTDRLRAHADLYKEKKEQELLSKATRNSLPETTVLDYRIQKLIFYEDNEIESRFTRINWT